MPFGLTNAPAVFQALVNEMVRDMLNQFVFVYLDDILIYSRSAQEHIPNVQQVLQRLLENQLFVKVEKCEFHRSTISFLRYIIAAGNIQMDPDKVRAVVDWPHPTSTVQLEYLLGFGHFYRQCIQGYSTLASPLSALTTPKVPVIWSPAAERVFSDLKQRFTTAPILINPDPSVRGGGQRLGHRSGESPFPAFCPEPEAASLHLPIVLIPLRGTTTREIENYSQLRWRWSSGGTG